jgi:hypothetical protein
MRDREIEVSGQRACTGVRREPQPLWNAVLFFGEVHFINKVAVGLEQIVRDPVIEPKSPGAARDDEGIAGVGGVREGKRKFRIGTPFAGEIADTVRKIANDDVKGVAFANDDHGRPFVGAMVDHNRELKFVKA